MSRPSNPPRDAATAVRVRAVTKYFDDVVALDQVDLDVPPATIHGVIGPNGAGKTTLLSLLLGLSTPDEGALEILGQPISRSTGIGEGVSGFVDAPGLYPWLTARRNLTELNRLRGRRRDQGVTEALDATGLLDVADDRVRGFSLGMRQRLGLAAALLEGPRLLVLDEPVNGLDPAGRARMHEVLMGLAAQGTTVVVTSHRMEDLARICSRVSLLANGRMVYDGTVAELSLLHDDGAHSLLTDNPLRARQIAAELPGVVVEPQAVPDDRLTLRAARESRDELLRRLVLDGVSIREFGPVVPPLEAAYLSLTGQETPLPSPEPDPRPRTNPLLVGAGR